MDDETQQKLPKKLTLAEKLAEALKADYSEYAVDGGIPRSPTSVPGRKAYGKKARLGTMVNKTPFCYEH